MLISSPGSSETWNVMWLQFFNQLLLFHQACQWYLPGMAAPTIPTSFSVRVLGLCSPLTEILIFQEDLQLELKLSSRTFRGLIQDHVYMSIY